MNDKNLADMLHGGCARVLAHFFQPSGARFTVVPQHTDLDQLVGFQRALHFREDRRRQAVVADHDHGFEGVGLCLEGASCCRCEFLHRLDSNSGRTGKPEWR